MDEGGSRNPFLRLFSKKKTDDEQKAEQEAEKNAEKSLADAVDSFVDLSDKMALDPDIEKYIGHNQFKKWNSESDLIKN